MKKRQATPILISVMALSMLGTLGLALPYPVLAPYFLDYPANELTHFMGFHPKILLGFSLAIYPFGLLFGSIFIGALSDYYGRRKVMLISLSGSLIGYLLTAWAISEESFIGFSIARLLTGVCEGNISIARAIAADLHPTIDRTRAISLVYAASSIGWLIGPVIGSYFVSFGVSYVFIIGALGMLVGLVLAFLYIEANNEQRVLKTSTLWIEIKQNNSLTLLKHNSILPIFWYYFFFSMGLNAFYDFFPVWFVDELGYGSQMIANATVILTMGMTLVSVFFVEMIHKRLGELNTMLLGTFLITLLLFWLPFSKGLYLMPLFFLIGAWIAVANNMIPTYLSNHFEHLGLGRVMGLQTSTFFITNVIIASIGGVVSVLSSTLVMIISAVLIGIALLVLFRFKKNLNTI